MFVLVDKDITETGMARYCVSYQQFNSSKFTEMKNIILQGLLRLENELLATRVSFSLGYLNLVTWPLSEMRPMNISMIR